MKPILVGMNNQINPRSGFELYPSPEGCTGHRLWKMLNSRTGCSRIQYLERFERRNLVRAVTYDRTIARLAACDMKQELAGSGRTIVLLGRSVQEAFGIPPLLVHPQVIGGITFRQIPHPSGRNLFYNEPENVRVVELLMEELYNEKELVQ